MNKLIIASASALALAACSIVATQPEATLTPAQQTEKQTSQQKIIQIVDDKNQVYIVTTKDNFATATLITAAGKSYPLYIAVSGSGMRLIDGKGVELHIKANEGVLTLTKGKTLNVKARNINF